MLQWSDATVLCALGDLDAWVTETLQKLADTAIKASRPSKSDKSEEETSAIWHELRHFAVQWV
jgi:hypothetical protein